MVASVIIITKNQREFLEKTLPVLIEQNLREQYEIIIVDSGSTDGAKEYARSLKKVRLVEIPSKNFNFARAFNVGARVARGEYLIRLSGDAIPIGKSFLKELLSGFEDEKVGGVFGKYTTSGRKGWGYPDFWPAWRFPKKRTRYKVGPFPLMGLNLFNLAIGPKAYMFAGGCCGIRRVVWKMRPFNEKLIAGEDGEYSWFLHMIGLDVVYVPSAKVLHEHKTNWKHTLWNYLGSKWIWGFAWNVVSYWLLRLVGVDRFKKFKRV